VHISKFYLDISIVFYYLTFKWNHTMEIKLKTIRGNAFDFHIV